MTPGTRPFGGLDFAPLREMIDDGAEAAPVRRARIGWEGETGTDHLTITPGRDVDVHVTTAAGFPLVARLFAPAGVWALPPIGDECLVVAEGGDWSAPGAPVCLWKHRLPPAHLTTTNAVLEVPAGGLLVGDGATKAAARTDDPIVPGSLAFVPGAPVPNSPAPGLTTVPVVITYTPPSGTPTVLTLVVVGIGIAISGGGSITLGGKVGPGSEKVKIE
jgi:hypothetical protein